MMHRVPSGWFRLVRGGPTSVARGRQDQVICPDSGL